jgi:hypothetical protein
VAAERRRIAILLHERERGLKPARYLVHHLAEFWREDGHEVVYLFGTDRFVPADLVLVHVDLSVVPEPYLEYAAAYPIVLNGRIRDVRKSVTSRQLVHAGDGWDGPVIVKSDLNCGGYPEFLYSRTGPGRLGLLRRAVARLAAPTWQDYRVFDRFEDVPAALLERPNLVVERFLPDLEDGLYHTHMYLFLGEGERCSRISAPHPVFKADDSTAAEAVEPHPAARAWREELGLDYGNIDYIARDGEAVLLDANKTTGSSTYLEPGPLRAQRRRQAEALYAYFEDLKPL